VVRVLARCITLMSVCIQSMLHPCEEITAKGHLHSDVVIAVWSM